MNNDSLQIPSHVLKELIIDLSLALGLLIEKSKKAIGKEYSN